MSNDDTNGVVVEGTGTVTVPEAGLTDKVTVRMVVIGLIALVAAVIICSFILAVRYPDRHMPEPLITMAVGLAGALSGILATTRSHQ